MSPNSMCEQAAMQCLKVPVCWSKACVMTTDNFLVVQSVCGERSQDIYCILTVFLAWFDHDL